MKKFEYREECFPLMGMHAEDMGRLSALGAEGWEMVSSFTENGTVYVHLKRER